MRTVHAMRTMHTMHTMHIMHRMHPIRTFQKKDKSVFFVYYLKLAIKKRINIQAFAYNNIWNILQLLYILRGTWYIPIMYIRSLWYIPYMYIWLNCLYTLIVYRYAIMCWLNRVLTTILCIVLSILFIQMTILDQMWYILFRVLWSYTLCIWEQKSCRCIV